MATLVFSVGGSLIIPEKIDLSFLSSFSSFIKKLSRQHKIVLVTGGGSIARKYINALLASKIAEPHTSFVGIQTTKLNANLLSSFFGKKYFPPDSLQEVKKQLSKERIVICGALGFTPHITSDGDAAQIAKYIHADLFINLTNVDGLYTKEPHLAGAKLIREITFKEFYTRARKIPYHSGEHFVLDQAAAKIIFEERIKTVLLNGKKLSELSNLFLGKPFLGTLIHD